MTLETPLAVHTRGSFEAPIRSIFNQNQRPLKQFKQFSTLPLELQGKIWEKATPRGRLLSVRTNVFNCTVPECVYRPCQHWDEHGRFWLRERWNFLPTTMSVCQRSRAGALRALPDSLPTYDGPSIRFSGKHDVIEFKTFAHPISNDYDVEHFSGNKHSRAILRGERPCSSIPACLKRAQHVAVDEVRLRCEDEYVGFWATAISGFDDLKSITFTGGWHHIQWPEPGPRDHQYGELTALH